MAGNKNSGGKNKKPKALKQLQGSLNSTRENNNIAKVPELLNLSMPTDLQLVAGATDVWNELAPDLVKVGILKKTDLQAFAIYCNEFARYMKMSKVLKEHGEIYLTSDGTPKKRPEVNVMNESLRIINSYQSRFGLSPADRDRINIQEDKPEGIENLII